MTNTPLLRGAQSALAYHFKKDRFPVQRQPLNRSFLKRPCPLKPKITICIRQSEFNALALHKI